jgi:hypothetical protein
LKGQTYEFAEIIQEVNETKIENPSPIEEIVEENELYGLVG